MKSIQKLCADYLRAFCDIRGIKLKSGHAHELVAGFLGYKSLAAMQADTNYSIENLIQASNFVHMPSVFIDERRKCLENLPADLPDTHTLVEGILAYLASEGKISGRFYASWEVFSKECMTEYLKNRGDLILPFNFWRNESAHDFFNKPLYEFKPKIERIGDQVKVIVNNLYQGSRGIYFEKIDLSVIINLRRVAGYVGFSNAEITVGDNSYQSARGEVMI